MATNSDSAEPQIEPEDCQACFYSVSCCYSISGHHSVNSNVIINVSRNRERERAAHNNRRIISGHLVQRLCRRTNYEIILETLIVTELVKKLLTFYGTRRFITVCTTAHHWSLS
jgi:hypothetical protein